jgi:hypothetical protein
MDVLWLFRLVDSNEKQREIEAKTKKPAWLFNQTLRHGKSPFSMGKPVNHL